MLAFSRWHPATDSGRPERRARIVTAGRRRSPGPGLAGWKLGTAGNVAVEFALALPVLMLLMLGSAEMARFVILHQKIDRVAVTMSDLVARAETISEVRAR